MRSKNPLGAHPFYPAASQQPSMNSPQPGMAWESMACMDVISGLTRPDIWTAQVNSRHRERTWPHAGLASTGLDWTLSSPPLSSEQGKASFMTRPGNGVWSHIDSIRWWQS